MSLGTSPVNPLLGGSGGGGGGGPSGGPAAPTSFTATPVSGTQINLAWVDSADETAYQIEQSPDNSAWTPIVMLDPGTTAYSVTELTRNVQYYFRIRSLDSSTTTSAFVLANATTLDIAALPPTEQAAIAFFDASDLSGTVVTSGSDVTAWQSAGGTPLIDNSDNEMDGTGFPALVSAGQNGLNYIRLSTGDKFEMPSGGDRYFSHTATQTLYMLCRLYSGTPTADFFRADNTNYCAELSFTSGRPFMPSSGSSLVWASSSTDWRLIQCVWSTSGGSHRLQVNGGTALTGAITYGAGTITSSTLEIGEGAVNMDIAEFVITNGAEGATGQAAMLAYVNDKWGLSLS